jgi:hypothetical protein
MLEIWKNITGHEGRYQVSNLGNVRSMDRAVTKKSAQGGGYHIRHYKGQLLKPILKRSSTSTGYLMVTLCHLDGSKPTVYVHRLVAEAFIPNADNLPFVMHLDDNRANNHVENLRWGTHDDNMADMVSKERQARGVDVGNAVLTNSDVLEIKGLLSTGLSYRKIAGRYGVDHGTIFHINKGNTWSHLTA